jgi:hypothetical protein
VLFVPFVAGLVNRYVWCGGAGRLTAVTPPRERHLYRNVSGARQGGRQRERNDVKARHFPVRLNG